MKSGVEDAYLGSVRFEIQVTSGLGADSTVYISRSWAEMTLLRCSFMALSTQLCLDFCVCRRVRFMGGLEAMTSRRCFTGVEDRPAKHSFRRQ